MLCEGFLFTQSYFGFKSIGLIAFVNSCVKLASLTGCLYKRCFSFFAVIPSMPVGCHCMKKLSLSCFRFDIHWKRLSRCSGYNRGTICFILISFTYLFGFEFFCMSPYDYLSVYYLIHVILSLISAFLF